MIARSIVFFLLLTSLLFAENNATIEGLSSLEENNISATPNKSNIMDSTYQEKEENNSTQKEKLDNTLELLKQYDNETASGSLQSEQEVQKKELVDSNSSSDISATTKLDDVSNLDIAKAQRKQRKIEREEAEEAVDTQSVQLIDTVVVKGSVLQGKIDQLTSEYISFKLIYGEGSIRINYSDIESLSTEHEYHIYFDGKETQGYITEIQDHAFLKVQHGKVEELITIAKVDRFVVSENEDSSFENRLRNTFPYWSGNMDAGVEYESGSNTKNKLKVAGHVERKRGDYKTILDVTYAYETTQTVDTAKVLNKHELYTFLEQDYRFAKNEFVFVELGYDFDVPRYVDNRLYPAGGYGYRMQAAKKRWVQFKVGGGYVYENFLGNTDTDLNITRPNSTNHYVAALFGVEAEYEIEDLIIINRVLLGANFFYMPGIKDLKENWLLRYSITASIPLSKALSLKMVSREITDSNPAPEVGNNKFTFDLYLSLRF